MAKGLGRAAVVADGRVDGRERVVAAVGVLNQGHEKHRAFLFNLFEDFGLARRVQFDKRRTVASLAENNDLGQAVEQQPAEAGGVSHGLLDARADVEVTRARQILARRHKAIQYRCEERPLGFVENARWVHARPRVRLM